MSGDWLSANYFRRGTVREFGRYVGKWCEWMEGGFLCREFMGRDFVKITIRRPAQARVLVEWFTSASGGLWPSHIRKGDLMDDLLKKALKADVKANGRQRSLEISGVMKAFPFVWAFLTCTEVEKGVCRETATLTISLEQDRLKACLRDRGAQRVAWGTGESLEGVLEDLEVRLKDGSIGWRPDRFAGKKR